MLDGDIDPFIAGPVCAVASDRAPGALWFSWLALSALVERSRPLPLVVVLHDADRRALPVRDAIGEWAESRACLVLAPELPTDPRRPGGDTAYARTDAAASARCVLAMVDELAERLDVELAGAQAAVAVDPLPDPGLALPAPVG